MQLFRTGVASLGVDREGIIDKLEKRQEGRSALSVTWQALTWDVAVIKFTNS